MMTNTKLALFRQLFRSRLRQPPEIGLFLNTAPDSRYPVS